MNKYTKKLGSDANYVKPERTYTETLTNEEITKMLEGYKQTDDISEVPLNTHVRYFVTKDENSLFRTGGMLTHKTNADTYVMLSNGKNTWSVQVANATFFYKMTHKEEIESIHEEYRKKLALKNKKIKQLETKITQLERKAKK